MKVLGYVLFVLGITTTTAFAQERPLSIDWGVTLGISSTQVHFKESYNSGSPAYGLSFDKSVDLTGGIFAELKFSRAKWISIRNEITHRKYDSESGDYYNGTGQTHAFGAVSANYLKYSLSFRAWLTKTKLRPFLSAGISPSVLLSQSNSYTIDYGTTQLKQPLIDKPKSSEFGYYGGAGLSYDRFAGEVRVESSNGLRPTSLNSPVSTVYILLSYRLLEGDR